MRKGFVMDDQRLKELGGGGYFIMKYEAGMSIMEIVNLGDISRRTAYRYKAYYDELKNNKMD